MGVRKCILGGSRRQYISNGSSAPRAPGEVRRYRRPWPCEEDALAPTWGTPRGGHDRFHRPEGGEGGALPACTRLTLTDLNLSDDEDNMCVDAAFRPY